MSGQAPGSLNRIWYHRIISSKIRRVRQPHEAYRLGGAQSAAAVPRCHTPWACCVYAPTAEPHAALSTSHAAKPARPHTQPERIAASLAPRIGGGEARTAAEERDERRDEVEPAAATGTRHTSAPTADA